MRLVWTAAGIVFLGIGIAGVVLPVLPGTVFLLAAAACLVRGSERLHGWLVTHPVLGKQLRILKAEEPMPLRAKIVAIAAMWVAVTLSIMGTEIVPLQVGLAVLAAIGTYFILRRR